LNLIFGPSFVYFILSEDYARIVQPDSLWDSETRAVRVGEQLASTVVSGRGILTGELLDPTRILGLKMGVFPRTPSDQGEGRDEK